MCIKSVRASMHTVTHTYRCRDARIKMRKLPTGFKTCFYSDRGAHSHTQGIPRVNCAPASGVPHPDLIAAPSNSAQRPSTPSTHTCNGAAPSQAPCQGSEAALSQPSRRQVADRESCAPAVATRKPRLQNQHGRSPRQKVQNASGQSLGTQRIQSLPVRGFASPFTACLAASNASAQSSSGPPPGDWQHRCRSHARLPLRKPRRGR